jgi:hypothetical protein
VSWLLHLFLIIYKDGHDHRIAIEGFKARLQRCSFAAVLLVTEHLSACQEGDLGGAVTAAVVDDPVGVLAGAYGPTLPMEISSL